MFFQILFRLKLSPFFLGLKLEYSKFISSSFNLNSFISLILWSSFVLALSLSSFDFVNNLNLLLLIFVSLFVWILLFIDWVDSFFKWKASLRFFTVSISFFKFINISSLPNKSSLLFVSVFIALLNLFDIELLIL